MYIYIYVKTHTCMNGCRWRNAGCESSSIAVDSFSAWARTLCMEDMRTQVDREARSSEIFRAFQLGPSIGVEMAMFLCLARMKSQACANIRASFALVS